MSFFVVFMNMNPAGKFRNTAQQLHKCAASIYVPDVGTEYCIDLWDKSDVRDLLNYSMRWTQ